MPRHDWYDDDDDNTMSRDRNMRGRSEMNERGGDYGRGGYERSSREYGSGGRGAMFDRDRERGMDRGGRIGGWGGLMGDESSGNRDRNRERDHDRHRNEHRMEQREHRNEEQRYGADDHNRGIPMDETKSLIASNKVEGTPVYDRHGEKLGSVHNFMVHKTKGHVVYAVLKHGGGFLGLNERYYPLEWNQLDYDTRLGGYHTRLDEEDLKSFGSFDKEGRWQSRSMGGSSGRERDHDRSYERSSRDSW